jgi:hypothetical protein
MHFLQRKYNTATVAATHIRIPIIKRGVVDYAVSADWTPAAGDVKIKVDNGSVVNIDGLPFAVTMGNSAVWEFRLIASELLGKEVVVMISDAATKAIEDQCFIIETFGHADAMYPSDPSANNTEAERKFLKAALSLVDGTVGNGTNTTTAVSFSGGSGAIDPTPTNTDQFKGRVIMFSENTATAALRGQGAPIEGSSTTGLTIAAGNALSTAPADGDTFTIH